MKKLFFVFVLILGSTGIAFAQENAQNDFWNFDTAYVQPVTSSQSSVTTAKVSGFTSTSVWDDMAKAFSTFVKGLSIRIW
jgi:hypothetical protein